jgi:hypothetical protein
MRIFKPMTDHYAVVEREADGSERLVGVVVREPGTENQWAWRPLVSGYGIGDVLLQHALEAAQREP